MVETDSVAHDTPIVHPETGAFVRSYGVALMAKLRSLRERHNRVSSALLVQADQSEIPFPYLAAALLKSIRASDHLVFWDKDCFLLILPETSRANGLAAGEKIRAFFARSAQAEGLAATISAAVAEIIHTEDDEVLEKRLRNYLRAAREAGGNQTRAFA